MLQFQATQNANVGQQMHPQPSTDSQPTMQTMRLNDQPQTTTTTTGRSSRKRKSPPDPNQDTTQQPQQQPPPPPPPGQHVLPPMMHHALPPGYAFALPPNFDPAAVQQPPPQQQPDGTQQPSPQGQGSGGAGGRALSSSKRAEQNRKAQRAFRERRDQHVKALESRSQLLDAALASADEANRRWEECRALVDQLRVENAALRKALEQAQLLPPQPASNNIPGGLATVEAGLKTDGSSTDQPSNQQSSNSKE